MRLIFTFVTLLTFNTASADGWTDIEGTNKAGNNIRVTAAWEEGQNDGRDYSLPEFRNLFNIVVSKKQQSKRFTDEPCEFKEQDGARYAFSCSTKAKSPLSGVTYLIKADKGECGGNFYICKSGCSDKAPQQMYQGAWEC